MVTLGVYFSSDLIDLSGNEIEDGLVGYMDFKHKSRVLNKKTRG